MHTEAEVVWNIPLGSHTAVCCLHSPEVAASARPGQFVLLSLTPLLRRPFSIAAAGGDRICILYQVVGPGTRDLRDRRARHRIELLGPLGKPFEPPEGRALLFVSGGAGLAGIIWLALNQAGSHRESLIIHGQKSRHFMDPEHAVGVIAEAVGREGLAPAVLMATDDGTRGFRGSAIDLLETRWRGQEPGEIAVLGCGPRPMLRALKGLCARHGVPCYLSVEERMGCGIGTCLGCAVPSTSGGYRHVCQDGPIFPAEEVEI